MVGGSFTVVQQSSKWSVPEVVYVCLKVHDGDAVTRTAVQEQSNEAMDASLHTQTMQRGSQPWA